MEINPMNERIRKLAERRAEAFRAMEGILEAAVTAGSETLTNAQERDYLRHSDAYNAASMAINAEQPRSSLTLMPHEPGSVGGLRAAIAEARQVLERPDGEAPNRPSPGTGIDHRGGGPTYDGRDLRDRLRAGDVVVLAREDRWADLYPDAEEPATIAETRTQLGHIARGMITGDWRSMPAEFRTQMAGLDALGGYLLPDPMSGRIIDKARNLAAVFRAGAMTVPIEGETLSLARLVTDPTGSWRHENVALGWSDLEFERITFRPKTLLIGVRSSRELFEDAQGLGETIEQAMAEANALELDRVALLGTGAAAQPLGVLNDPDIQTVATVGTPTDFDDVSLAVQGCRNFNEEPNALLWSPRTAGTYDRLKDTTNQPLRPPESYANLQKHVTKQLPDNLGGGANESIALVGDYTKLLVGIRLGFSLEVSRDAAEGSDSAFKQHQVWFKSVMRADVLRARPKAFCKLPGILQ